MTYWAARTYLPHPARLTLVITLLLSLLVGGCTLISLLLYDLSPDGQAYHQEGVYQLAHGWNPFLDPYLKPLSNHIELNHFPKGPWILAATMYRLTGHIEAGKFTNLILVCAAFLLALAVLSRFRDKPNFWPLTMAALVAANPVALCQLSTFYVDGQMASLLACLVALCFLARADGNSWVYLVLFESAVLAIEVKFTGPVYVAMLFAGFIALLVWKKRPSRKPLAVALLALGLGTFAFGMHPYTFNTVNYGHPFYPFFGRSGATDMGVSEQAPLDFQNSNRVRNLVISIFSRSRVLPDPSSPKLPWQIDWDECADFAYPDVRTGGFGPLFAAALVASLTLLGLGLIERRRACRTCAGIIGILIGSVLPVSACWWARYVPQLWLIPLVAMIPLGGIVQSTRFRRLSWLPLLLLLANTMGIGLVNLHANRTQTRHLQEEMNALRTDAPFRVNFGEFRSQRFRLREAGIPFTEDDEITSCDPEFRFFCVRH